jgi:hypothetical protein
LHPPLCEFSGGHAAARHFAASLEAEADSIDSTSIGRRRFTELTRST